MAKKSATANGHTRIEDAIAILIQNQATFVANQTETNRAMAEYQRRHMESERETAERFARIESQMTEIIRVLNDHSRHLELERLTEAVRDRIGFKAPQAGQPARAE
jgi:hypothetical protein